MSITLPDIASVRRATVGVRRAYFVYPVRAGLLEATTTFAVAAKDAGLEIVVNNDHLNTAEDAASPHTRHHWLAEQILNFAGVGSDAPARGAVLREPVGRDGPICAE
jgi:NAD(P)H dehydrogenase (quinone)